MKINTNNQIGFNKGFTGNFIVSDARVLLSSERFSKPLFDQVALISQRAFAGRTIAHDTLSIASLDKNDEAIAKGLDKLGIRFLFTKK